MKICTLNCLNLFLNMDKMKDLDINSLSESEWEKLSPHYGDVPRNKSLYQTTYLAKAILEINADVFVLQEVGGYVALKNFNKYFLDDKYNVVLKEENSYRGIFVGYLVSKKYSYEVESFSDRKFMLNNEEKFFSRNLNCLHVFENESKIASILGVHLKSQRNDETSKDVDSIETRSAEIKALFDIVESIQNSQKEPLIVAGDFNCDVSDSVRMESKYVSKEFVDIHQIKKSSDLERATFVFFQSMGSVKVVQQLDFMFIHKNHVNIVNDSESGTVYYKNDYGDSLGLPSSLYDKSLNPSDHQPVILKLKI